MAARFMQLLCLSCNIWMILPVWFLQGVVGDIPDDVVYTDLHKTVHKGDSVVLTCRFRGTPLAVWWKKGDDPETAPNLVSWTQTDDVTGKCEGEKPCQTMEMNENHSLVIKEVSIAEQGRYICRVTIKGILIHNFTDIRVFSPPMEPFPMINECQMNSPSNNKPACTISTNHSVEISCTASGYFPDIKLYFLHGSTSLRTKNTIEVTNLDGTKNKTIYAIATASEISYVCFAFDIPGSQEQRTTHVLINLPEIPSHKPTGTTIQIDKTDGSVAKIVVPVIVVPLILTVIIIFRRWRKQSKREAHQAINMEEPIGSRNGSEEEKTRPQAAPRGHGSIQHTNDNPDQAMYAMVDKKKPGGDAPDRGNGPGQNQPQGMLYADLDLSHQAGHTKKHVPKNENDVVVYSSILE